LYKAAVCFNNNKGKIMKYFIRIFVIVVTLNIVFAIFPKRISAQPNDSNYQEFYDQLSPYGQWVQDPTYGYVWIPSEGSDFTPYLTNGYWVMTEDGWTWVSNYEWGWAPFHYGRWDYNNSYSGWYWVPDNQWGPSWVTWRSSAGYYGWAPMRPGISINASFGGNSGVSNNHWTFVRDKDIESHDIGRNFINRKNNKQIMNKSTIINKTYMDNKSHATYVSGPGREDVQKITGKTIQSVAINERNKPGQSLANNQLQVYRPQLQKNKNGNKAAPSKVTSLKEIKPVQGKKQLTTVNTPVKTNIKNQVNTQQKTNIPNKRERPVQNSQSPNINTPKNNINTNRQPKVNTISRKRPIQTSQSPKINTPKNNNSTNRQPKVNNMNPPKQNGSMRSPIQNRTIKQPAMNNMQPARSRNMEQPAHSNPTEEKREDRK
jgi:hypothetical protein